MAPQSERFVYPATKRYNKAALFTLSQNRKNEEKREKASASRTSPGNGVPMRGGARFKALSAMATESLAFSNQGEDMEEEDDMEFELDPTCCLMCDKKHKTLEKCMVHMHKFHGFFIPDIDYLKDPKGFLTYVGLKVKRDFMCLYCNELCHPFSSLEAVRKHMEAKSHCKVHYGDGGDEEDAELEEFYDYSSSYAGEGENQMVVSGEPANTVELFGGSELVITKRLENKVTSRTLGSREFMRYYKQKPPPSSQKHIVNSLALRYKSMGLATVQSKEDIVRMKVMREINKRGARMRVKLGMKSNVIRNLPNNVTY